MKTETFTEKKVETQEKGIPKSIQYIECWRNLVESLIQALNDENPLVRWAAAGALGELADTRALNPLKKALNDKDIKVQRKAAWALRKMGQTHHKKPATTPNKTPNLPPTKNTPQRVR
ncbi:MAG: HEAT repeat domain-containing protein [Candidatus Jordarchaeaceae archaeon]